MSFDPSMGGYGAFVWPCFVAMVVVYGGLVLQARWAYRRAQRAVNTKAQEQ